MYRRLIYCLPVWVACMILFNFSVVRAQTTSAKYPSLLWEITGNGLTKPSYLFGTMHISNKMVFHLSDSFYIAIRNSDVVAIELNPEQWQSEILRIGNQSNAYRIFNLTYYTDYLNQNSFTGNPFMPALKNALRMEPELNNSLLYRNQRGMDNFEEDTYLDLYIYQTGKKLGKKAAGVETFIGSQKMAVEAYVDMSNESSQNRQRNMDVNSYEVFQELQDAYRRGDLDALDSLNKLTESSESFTEKFLYKRNEMQANSMDSIMQHQGLFTGVGAAHLPGSRGVIELLRKKGYKLRPVFMQDRDAVQKEMIDTVSVPVTFTRQFAADSFISVSVPGKLNVSNEDEGKTMYYADMANGSYYVISRIETSPLFNGNDDQALLRSIDSMLYENIPGRILSKKKITVNGYEGWDITNRTRNGDGQRYQIIATPSEVVVLKMGGKRDYVFREEASQFFSSLSLRPADKVTGSYQYRPESGGFTVQFPTRPAALFSKDGPDGLPEWRYESVDPDNGNIYTIIRKNIYSFHFAAPDTFDLQLMAESYGMDKGIDKKVSQKLLTVNGRPVLDVVFKLKSGDFTQVRFLLNGPIYYALALRSSSKNEHAKTFFNSFALEPYRYEASTVYTDSFQRYKVQAPVYPAVDADVMDMLSYARRNKPARDSVNYGNRPESGYSNFISYQTGEVVVVNSYHYPEYYFVKDSAKFWREELNYDSTMVVVSTQKVDKGPGTDAWLLYVADTASSRVIKYQVMMRGMDVLTAFTMVDTTQPESSMLKDIFNTLDFVATAPEPGIFDSKLDLFTRNFSSADTVVRKRARNALSSMYFGKAGLPVIQSLIAGLDSKDKEYYNLKTKLINELGYIDDSTTTKQVAATLDTIYKASGDTALFQNSVFNALARQRTSEATALFKELILLDPPVFEEDYEYSRLFNHYADTPKLAVELFPDILNLTSIEDYKRPIRRLLASLVDSNLIEPAIYEKYVGNIYFDAKIAVKRMQAANESSLGGGGRSLYDDEDEEDYTSIDTTAGLMGYYTTLLMPFYAENPNLPHFFEKLLQSSDMGLRLHTAFLMLRNNKPVADSLWASIASDKQYQSYLYGRLQREGHPGLFPAKYKTADQISSAMVYASLSSVADSLTLLKKQAYTYKGKAGDLYYYKYKVKSNGNWFQVLNGLVQKKGSNITSTGDLLLLTGEKYKDNTSSADQLAKLLTRVRIAQEPSGAAFFVDGGPTEVPAPVIDRYGE